MADAPRPLTRQQLAAFIKDHQALRTMERMSQVSLVDTPGDMADLSAAISSINASIALINAALVSVNALVSALTDLVDDNSDLAATVDGRINQALQPVPVDDLTPPPLQLTGPLIQGLIQSLNHTWTGQNSWTQAVYHSVTPAQVAAITSFAQAGTAEYFNTRLVGAREANPTTFRGLRVDNTFASPSAVASNALLVQFTGGGYDSAQFRTGTGAFSFRTTEAWNPGALGTQAEIAVTATGTSALATVVTVQRDATSFATNIGLTTPSSVTLPANGVYLPSANTVGLTANTTLTARYTGTTFETVLQTLFSGVTSPAQFTSNQNDLAVGNVTVLRASTDASRNLTGIAGGAAGRVLLIFNVGAQPLVLTNDDAASTAANRFLLASGTSTTVQAGGGVGLWYDGTSSRWRQFTRVA